MSLPQVFMIVFVATGVSACLTGFLYRYAEYFGIIDIPNSRSSHKKPTARGGGMSIGLVVLGAVLISILAEKSPAPVSLAVLTGGSLVLICGWLDDSKGLSTLSRILTYLLAAMTGLYWLGGFSVTGTESGYLNVRAGGSVVAVLGITWLTNLFNFMDGTDGLAATEAITVNVFASVIFYLSGFHDLALITILICASTLGFLIYNWPPAKIFMGDSGSCLLGYCLGVLMIAGEKTHSLPVLAWLILLSVFICDATFTLIRRLVCREKWYYAHRTHAYQLLVHNVISHKQLALGVLSINCFILWPLTVYAMNQPARLLFICVFVYLLNLIVWGFIQYHYFWKKELYKQQDDSK